MTLSDKLQSKLVLANSKSRRIFCTVIFLVLGCCWISSAQAITPATLGLKASYPQGAIIRGQAAAEVKTILVGTRQLRLDSQQRFVFGVGRDAAPQLALFVTDSENRQHTVELAVTPRTYNLQRVNGVPGKTVTPPAGQLERIRRESALAAKARKPNSSLTDFAAEFHWPLVGPITGVYGSQRIYNGTPKNPHYGVDVAAPNGTVVVAPAGGVVRLAYKDMFFSGGTLIVDHGHGLTSTFIHLSAILVAADQRVERGQPIAKVGATGRATGPHLDWRMNWFTERVDPQLLVGPMPAPVKESKL